MSEPRERESFSDLNRGPMKRLWWRFLTLFRQAAQPPPGRSPALASELAEAQRIARVGGWRWDLASDVVLWSETVFEVFGLPPAETAPSYADQRRLFTADSFARLDKAVDAAISAGLAYEIELELLHSSGARRWMTVRGEAVRDSAGHVVALRGIVQDVSERRRIEQALRDSQQRFRAIFDSMLQFIGVLSPDGRLLDINQTALDFSGLQAADVVGKQAWDTYWWNATPQTQDRLRDAVMRAARGELVRYDAEVRGADGRIITLDFSLKPVFDADGKVELLIPEGRDVTEDRRTRAALAESESRFRQSMRNAPIGKALVGLDGAFIEVNEALSTMLGYSMPELQAKTFQDLTHPDDLTADLAQVEALIEGKRDSYRMYKRYIRSDGRVVDAQLDVTLLRNADGAPLHFISQIQDVTERSRLEEQRQALNQRLTLALQVSGIGVWDFDLAAGNFDIDDALYRIYGKKRGDVTDYAAWRDTVAPEDFPRAEAAFMAAIEQKTSQVNDFRIQHPKLGLRFIESAFGVVLDQNQEVVRLVGVNMDVTERWQAEHRMSESRALLRNLIDNLPMWISMVDAKGRYVVTNRRNAKTLGMPVAKIEGRHYRDVLPAAALQRNGSHWAQAIAGATVEATDHFVEDGRVIHVQGVYLPISEGPQAGNSLAVFSDVTDLKHTESKLGQLNHRLEQRIAEVLALQELLSEQATRDGLTELFNRRYFDDALSREIDRAQREAYEVSLIMADFDHFKRLNDRHGHQVGDAVLQAWGELLRQEMRASDILCRYGGEEFAIVLPRCSLEQAAARAESLRKKLEDQILTTRYTPTPIMVTISLGVACAQAGAGSPEDLIRAADGALYRAKNLGRNRVQCELSHPSDETAAR
ncbi:MAG: hypothetical protein JWQ90_2702 [Hydrocarboniphaga sp.]|uniref:bifunctional diguanylate cyclase/phosphodiesterase n=1 Tax=Hydrocarboniphaga sp. TaxID=2033016 RepID=UPI00261EC25D|nr:bifunctional diguanylate cyclase/phosphodiesterase [Hydrocarboniphaga sp.]MDB5970252.1 hypothetical protein [Hydrocarboniphaga sp.]